MQRDKLINFMSDVQSFEKNMSSLSDKWDLLTLLGSMSNIGMDTSETRKAFEDLLDQPLKQLVHETFNKSLDELRSKAQSSIDILIRNLFERTADIGFLATDEDIRKYLKFLQLQPSAASDEWRHHKIEKKESLLKRFQEYVSKYSVYDDIILLDTHGKVLAQLDQTAPISSTKDPLVEESLKTHQGYVETFRSSDLTHQRRSLIYSYRVEAPESSEPLGVLCLVFKFEDELKSIFQKLTRDNPYITLTLLSDDGEVIASSTPHHIAVGSMLQAKNTPKHQMYYGGFEYLYQAVTTKGYQGYEGPGWIGHAMVPMHLAFQPMDEASYSTDSLFESIATASDYFPEELKDILEKAKKIQSELDITVWNGNVQIANSSNKENPFSKALLGEISKTGEETKKIFDHTVANLNTAMLARYMEDLKFQSSLAIEIMDRNLYERANDCRWWALTTSFREILQKPFIDLAERQKMDAILSYINGLYTVYTDMFIYNHEGTILSVSNESASHMVGKKIPSTWANETLGLETTQSYSVSKFEETPFYEGRHTYVYHACIRNFENNPIGGISIVFDAEPQFQAMLEDVLPKDENQCVKKEIFALFIDRNGYVLSSTSPDISTGQYLSFPSSIIELSNGRSEAQMLQIMGTYYAVGATSSKGYREYKLSDGYDNDVIALFLRPVGEIQSASHSSSQRRNYVYPKAAGMEETCEISTFFVGNTVFAIESTNVVCSLARQELTPILHASEYNLGVIGYDKRMVSVISLSKLLGMEKSYDKDTHTVILVRTKIDEQSVYLGLAVDAIYSSPEIPVRSISHYGNVLRNENSLTKAVIIPDRAEDFGNEMISILDIQKIYTQLVQPHSRPLQKVMA